ncbi:hypothetical protein RO3G_01068 [Rhizopus delemar RA 99-880]|uniref:Stress-associated endoplasmic reticulum protein n=1 Tax=Rhizopus delemar (strain RA 99-880 / ATCC MYA-4621 / FGSC 9543 / NRRL 43880) TaxID=246409 RepID=I1BJI4_RHIO9|nr:hypothetical protein RO3G_01068 [Rhizopus delemar RA 99-880]|eukprot:EIE76364.1 hypothetical protein RO3G_01068 [Rhizopus delemar RA 99-880]
MATAPTIRQKNNLYKNRAINHKVASKAAEQSKSISKTNYSYWIIGLLCFAMFGGVILQLIDLIF